MINSLHIQHFRSITELDLDLDGQSVFLTGLNGTGKSSVLHAIRMALFGRCELTAADGKGAAALVQDGHGSAIIQAQYGEFRLTCTIKAQGSPMMAWAAKHTGEGPTFTDPLAFWSHIGVKRNNAEAVANPAVCLGRGGGVGYLLSDLLTPNIGPQDLTQAIGQDRDKPFWAWVSNNRYPTAKPDDLKALGDAAYSERREIKRELSEIAPELTAVIPPYPQDAKGKPITNMDDVTKTLADLTAKIETLHMELGAAQAQAREISTVKPKTLEAQVAKLQDEVPRLKQAHEDSVQAYESQSKALQAILHEKSGLMAEMMVAESRLRIARDEMGKYEAASNGGKCPTCERQWSKAIDQKLRGPALKDVNDARANIDVIKARGVDLDTKADAIRDEIKDLKASSDEALKAYGKASTELAESEKTLERILAVQNIRPVDEIEAEIKVLSERRERGTQVLGVLREINRLVPFQEKAQALNERVEFLDWVVKGFRDGEISNRFMASGTDAFTDAVNAILNPIGYQMGLDVDGKLVTVMVGRRTGYMVPYRALSKGEQLLAQLALCMTPLGDGAPILLDDVEGLDGENKQAAFKVLRETDRQVIVAGAWGLRGRPDVGLMERSMGFLVVDLTGAT